MKWLFVLLVFFALLCTVNTRAEDNILSGKVLAINTKFDFVIVNLGKENKVKEGMVFMVHRDRKLIGKIKVEEVFPEMSSCVVLPEWKQCKFKIDDGVLSE